MSRVSNTCDSRIDQVLWESASVTLARVDEIHSEAVTQSRRDCRSDAAEVGEPTSDEDGVD